MANDYVLEQLSSIDDDVFFDYTLINQNLLYFSLLDDEETSLDNNEDATNEKITITELYY